jgi:hypothetical protein
LRRVEAQVDQGPVAREHGSSGRLRPRAAKNFLFIKIYLHLVFSRFFKNNIRNYEKYYINTSKIINKFIII